MKRLLLALAVAVLLLTSCTARRTAPDKPIDNMPILGADGHEDSKIVHPVTGDVDPKMVVPGANSTH
jgi:hypothetical protein